MGSPPETPRTIAGIGSRSMRDRSKFIADLLISPDWTPRHIILDLAYPMMGLG
jgi:hypothetical protein